MAERINRHLKQQLANYKVPDVMEYVEEKASLYELQKKVKCWERKVDIANVSVSVVHCCIFSECSEWSFVTTCYAGYIQFTRCCALSTTCLP